MDAKHIPISAAKGHLSALVVESDDHDVVLMRHGRPAAVLMSQARHEALIERHLDLLDRLSVHERDGVTMPFDKLVAELGLED